MQKQKKDSRKPSYFAFFLCAALAVSGVGCSSAPRGDQLEPISQVYPAPLIDVWKATLKALKNYELSEKNREGGIIRSAWIDNTKAVNFSDAFERGDTVHSSRFKLAVNVFPGAYQGKEATQVTIRKKQQVEKELMQGWRDAQLEDHVIEQTILYRIERILINEKRLEKSQSKTQEPELPL